MSCPHKIIVYLFDASTGFKISLAQKNCECETNQVPFSWHASFIYKPYPLEEDGDELSSLDRIMDKRRMLRYHTY